MKACQDRSVDVSIYSEVLEHVKECDMSARALSEIKRITKPGGLFLGIPNSELSGDHGFTFEEMSSLLVESFEKYCIFENALVLFTPADRSSCQRRAPKGRTGFFVTEKINLSETVLPSQGNPELKKGIPAGKFQFSGMNVDTRRLHNTHSWIILALNA